jgi:hypothetical protein
MMRIGLYSETARRPVVRARELRDAMDTLSLEFLGFDLPSLTLTRYRERFAEAPEGLDLANWETFESENPSCFGSMNRLRARRRR